MDQQATRKGYRQTELGEIPDDWSVVKVDQLLELLTDFEANGSFESVAQNVRVSDSEGYAWYVRATDLENHTPISAVKYVDKPSYRFLKKTALSGNEVLLTKRGEIGKVYFFRMLTNHATLAPNMYLLKLNEKVVARYLYYFFASDPGQGLLRKNDASTTMGALYKDDVKAMKLAIPRTRGEQTAIANALSDTDALITSLEKLINKKRAIKTATMQQLLTGKTRLPGFDKHPNGKPKGTKQTELGEIPEDWEIGSIGQFTELITKGTTPTSIGRSFIKSGVTFVKVESVLENGTFDRSKFAFIDDTTDRLLSRSRINDGDLLISIAGALGRAIIASRDILPANTNQALAIVRLTKGAAVVPSFVYHYTKSTFFRRRIEATSSQGAQPNLSLGDISDFPIVVPSRDEQISICEALDSMNAELSALDQRLKKINQIKQGMMQELLTGRTRLV